MADNQHIVALGDYRFSIGVSEYESLQRTLSLHWAKTDIINNRPNYQFGGIDNEGITISGAIFNYRQNTGQASEQDQLSLIRQEALAGKPLRLVLYTGQNLGFWVVKSVTERQSQFIRSAPLKQAFDISIHFFGDTL